MFLFLSTVLLEFSSRKGRYPDLTNKTNDWQELIEIRDTVFEQLQVDNEMLPDTFVRCVIEDHYFPLYKSALAA